MDSNYDHLLIALDNCTRDLRDVKRRMDDEEKRYCEERKLRLRHMKLCVEDLEQRRDEKTERDEQDRTARLRSEQRWELIASSVAAISDHFNSPAVTQRLATLLAAFTKDYVLTAGCPCWQCLHIGEVRELLARFNAATPESLPHAPKEQP